MNKVVECFKLIQTAPWLVLIARTQFNSQSIGHWEQDLWHLVMLKLNITAALFLEFWIRGHEFKGFYLATQKLKGETIKIYEGKLQCKLTGKSILFLYWLNYWHILISKLRVVLRRILYW